MCPLSRALTFLVVGLIVSCSGGAQHAAPQSISWSEQQTRLYPIEVGGLTGYIDVTGRVVIAPQFHSASTFSEGLAAARKDGLFGYINTFGKFVISPQFHFATTFHEGVGIVFKEGKPFYINTEGKKLFECPYEKIESFDDGLARVQACSGRYGLVNLKGSLIFDTVYYDIASFHNGIARVYADVNPNYSSPMQALMDTGGNFVVAYGTYDFIGEYTDGYYGVSRDESPDPESDAGRTVSYLDASGKLVFSEQETDGKYFWGWPQNGMLETRFMHPASLRKGAGHSNARTSRTEYYGYTSLSGSTVSNDANCKSTTPFTNGRAFIRNQDEKWTLINTSGKQVTSKHFDDINQINLFRSGHALVAVGDLWGVIDTNGDFTAVPQFVRVHYTGIVNDSFLFYSGQKYCDSCVAKYGLAKIDGTVLLNDTIDQVDEAGFVNGLLRCSIGGRLAYISKQGQIVWHQPLTSQAQLIEYNVDYMELGQFMVGTYPDGDRESVIVDAHDIIRSIQATDKFAPSQLSVVVYPDSSVAWQDLFNGMRVAIVNTTGYEKYFDVHNGCLQMKVQAIDKTGAWADIGYLPSISCGTRCETLSLPSASILQLATPVYAGMTKTRMRISLSYRLPLDGEKWRSKEVTIYSNEYDGSVNPAQFWRKAAYRPKGIPDSYVE